MKPTLYLIAGPNGSGKTTLGLELLREVKDAVWLNVDEVAAKLGDKIGLASGRIIIEKIDENIKERKSFIWESVLASDHYLRVFEKARKAKYEIVLLYVFIDFPDANIARIKKRVALGGHHVPDETVRRRFYKSIKNFWTASNLADKWKLYYNGDDDYELVAEGNKNAEQILNDDLHKKFKKGLKDG
jgi:predicted ABC-type ATPase